MNPTWVPIGYTLPVRVASTETTNAVSIHPVESNILCVGESVRASVCVCVCVCVCESEREEREREREGERERDREREIV